MMVAAERIDPSDAGKCGETMSHLIAHEQCVFSGLVLKTNRGVAITTNRGTFLVKGIEIGDLVGQNVRVAGVIKDESIFAVGINY